MRITGIGMPATTLPAETSIDNGKPAAPASAAAGTAPALQSAVLQPALAALRDMPEIDQAKIEALRDALARGDVPFDAGRLAGLIERYHGNRE
ncbi:MAG TPA: flagellar biosynthesis anti-sigma factor FlgM [Azonexus sp.]